jgi:hypothetical protein
LLPFGCSFPKGVVRFYPDNSKSLATFLEPSLSASIQGVIAANFRLSLLSDNASPPSSASPCIGQTPISNLTVKWILHQFFFLSRRKYFKFCRCFTSRFRAGCGKFQPQPVEKNVENFASRLSLKFKNPGDFPELQNRLWKITETDT